MSENKAFHGENKCKFYIVLLQSIYILILRSCYKECSEYQILHLHDLWGAHKRDLCGDSWRTLYTISLWMSDSITHRSNSRRSKSNIQRAFLSDSKFIKQAVNYEYSKMSIKFELGWTVATATSSKQEFMECTLSSMCLLHNVLHVIP